MRRACVGRIRHPGSMGDPPQGIQPSKQVPLPAEPLHQCRNSQSICHLIFQSSGKLLFCNASGSMAHLTQSCCSRRLPAICEAACRSVSARTIKECEENLQNRFPATRQAITFPYRERLHGFCQQARQIKAWPDLRLVLLELVRTLERYRD